MSRVSAALPLKSLQEHERKFLKVAGSYLAQEKIGGPAALADLLDMVASWHSLRTDIEFGEYCKRCRGGFSSGELMAFLYAYPFPKAEWSARVQEAFKGMDNL
ncbi:hypothetical protein [Pseudomonas graminis]|uniref:hypothetical protein n=1 Tax=Pseudomonas graminis TaxID=158627 RepID=UPI00114CCC99|nr:hypothetical protein [Pseudomonas graminis]